MARIQCSLCNKEVTIAKQRVKAKNYCSRKCYSLARETKRIAHCFICEKEMQVKPSSIGKYCSRECAAIGYIATGKEKKIRQCMVCNKSFMQAFFMDSACSTQCEIIHKKLKPLFIYNPENNEPEYVEGIPLRGVDPFLGF